MSTIGVCWKWLRDGDGGVSAADEAALEIALTVAGEHLGTTVRVVTGGDAAADEGLRRALAAGAGEAVRVDSHSEAASAAIAGALAPVVADCDVVLCGDHSLDRGSGSVPAYLAGLLARPQALGLIEVDPSTAGAWRATRRLDGGRRQLLTIRPPAVLSVEAPAASLRRAPLPAARAAATAPIDVRPGPREPGPEASATVTPFAPRPRVVPAPTGAAALDRILALTDTSGSAPAGEVVTAEPPAAAELIISTLREWGYVP